MLCCVQCLANYTRDARKKGYRFLSEYSITLWSSAIYLKLLTSYIKPSKYEISLKIFSEVIELSHAYRETNRMDKRGGVNRRIFATCHWDYVKNVEYNGTTYWSTTQKQTNEEKHTTVGDATFNNTWERYSCNPF
jgi:hypothetical protein